jgi:cytochrome P450
MSHRTVLVARHADVRAVLDDPRFTVPPVHDAAPASPSSSPSRREHGLAWLRATAVRFSNGDDHRRRRSVALDLLSGLTPFDLRAEAAARARARRSARCGSPERPDTVDDAAALVPVAVLGSRLGVAERDLPAAVEAVRTIAAVYLSGAAHDRLPQADAAVRRLSALLDTGGDQERTAQRIVLLVQSCAATAGLIRNVLALVDLHRPFWSRIPHVAELVTETLRFDPPARRTRRLAAGDATVAGETVPAGTEVVLDLAAANRDPAVFTEPDRFLPGRPDAHHLAFGHGPRPCPGADHATALACGVLDTVLAFPPH